MPVRSAAAAAAPAVPRFRSRHVGGGSCRSWAIAALPPDAISLHSSHLEANFGAFATELEMEGALHVTTLAAATCEAQYGPMSSPPSLTTWPHTQEQEADDKLQMSLASCLATPMEAAETEAHEAHQLAQGIVTYRINRPWAYGASLAGGGGSSERLKLGGPLERWDSMVRRIRRRRYFEALVSGALRSRDTQAGPSNAQDGLSNAQDGLSNAQDGLSNAQG